MTLRKLLPPLRFFAIISALGFVALAVAAPFLVEGKAMREHLRERLEEWSGGKVAHMGDIGLASFLALTVEAKGVTLENAGKLGPIERIEAPSLKAIVAFSDLLTGNLGFEKLIVNNPRIHLRDQLETYPDGGLAPAFLQLQDALDTGAFDTIVVRGAKIAGLHSTGDIEFLSLKLEGRASGVRKVRLRSRIGGQKLSLSARAKPSADGLHLSLSLNGPYLAASFSGNAAKNGTPLSGDVRLAVHDVRGWGPLSELWPELPLPRVPVSLSGRLDHHGTRWAFDHASLRIGGSVGSGFLSLSEEQNGRYALDGTISWTELVLADMVLARPPHAKEPARSIFSRADADLRISADHVVAFGQSMHGSAIALVIRDGRLWADLAELSVFNGTARGRFEADLAKGEPVSLGASIEGADLLQLTAAFLLPPVISGKGDVSVDLRFDGNDESQLRRAEGRVRVTGLDTAMVSDSLSRQIIESIAGEVVPFRFPAAPLMLENPKLTANISGGSAALKLAGILRGAGTAEATGTLDLTTRQIEGRIEIAGLNEAEDARSGILPASARRPAVHFKGTPTQLRFFGQNESSLFN